MTLIPQLGAAIGPIVVAFLAAALIALLLTPVVRVVVLRYKIVDRPNPRRVNVVAVPRGGGLAVSAAFLVTAGAFLYLNHENGWLPIPSSLSSPEVVALFLGGAAAAVLGAIDDLLDLRARWQLVAQLALAVGAVALGISIDFIANLFGPGIVQ